MIDEAFDIDWFALDRNNRILHFASGGGEIADNNKRIN